MKINDLSKELNITNKDLISYLKSKGYKVSSHMQNATDEMIEDAMEAFKTVEEKDVLNKEETNTKPQISKKAPEVVVKTFKPDDMIVCRSVTPWEIVQPGIDGRTMYRWSCYNDTEYVTYKDLQFFRTKDLIKKANIIIEDPDLCYQWRHELGDAYKIYLGVDYPEEFFDLPDDKFRTLLQNAPYNFQEVIKYTAMNMVRNENYPTVQKLKIVDELLGTCIREFL